MPDARLTDKIHRDLDGELSPVERAELQSLLDGDPEARRFRDEFAEVSRALAACPQAEPPARLRDDIASELRQVVAGRRSAHRFTDPSKRRMTTFRVGFGIAALIVFALFVGPLRKNDLHPDQARGTLAPLETSVTDWRRIPIEDDVVRGSIVAAVKGLELAIRPEIETPARGTLQVSFDGARLDVVLVTGAARHFAPAPGRLTVEFDDTIPEVRLARRDGDAISVLLRLEGESAEYVTEIDFPGLTNFSEQSL